MEYWSKIRKKYSLRVREETKFETLEKKDGWFVIKTSRGVIKAKNYSMHGNRVAQENWDLKMKTLQRWHIIFLILSNTGDKELLWSVAEMLLLKLHSILLNPILEIKLKLLVRGPSMDTANEENQKLVNDLQRQEGLKIWYKSSVIKIEKDFLVVDRDGEHVENSQ